MTKGMQKVRTTYEGVAQYSKRTFQRFLMWYKKLRRSHVWRWRLLNAGFAVLVILGILMPIAQYFINNHAYSLSPEALQLVGKSDPKLTKQLSWDDTKNSWQFNA